MFPAFPPVLYEGGSLRRLSPLSALGLFQRFMFSDKQPSPADTGSLAGSLSEGGDTGRLPPPPRWPCSGRRARGSPQPSVAPRSLHGQGATAPLPPHSRTLLLDQRRWDFRAVCVCHNAPCNGSLHVFPGRLERTSSGARWCVCVCRTCCPVSLAHLG